MRLDSLWLDPLRPGFARPAAALAAWCGLALLGGCANVAWERAFYEGWRSSNQRAAPADGAPVADAAQRLPRYEDYERERQRAQGGAAKAPALPRAAAAAEAASAPASAAAPAPR
jgi:hypothetical protein